MGTFFSIPGMKPSGGEGRANMDRQGANFRGNLPDPRDNPDMADFYANRNETSHAVGMEAGERFNYKDAGGEVLHEEYDQHTAEVIQHVKVNSQTGSGTRKLIWKPDDNSPRTLIQTDDKRGD